MSIETNLANGTRQSGQDQSLVTAYVGQQLYAFPILSIDDTLRVGQITPAPGAPPEIPGVINLRGKIVTTICMRRVLRCADTGQPGRYGIIACCDDEYYCLLFDKIGEIIPRDQFLTEATPGTIDQYSSRVSTSIARIGEKIAIILNCGLIVQECVPDEHSAF